MRVGIVAPQLAKIYCDEVLDVTAVVYFFLFFVNKLRAIYAPGKGMSAEPGNGPHATNCNTQPPNSLSAAFYWYC